MTNGLGKSDSPVVPAKSPNKAGQPAAEGMEGRGLTKGNLPQQNASRTPSRRDAPSALERVRQAASKQTKEARGEGSCTGPVEVNSGPLMTSGTLYRLPPTHFPP